MSRGGQVLLPETPDDVVAITVTYGDRARFCNNTIGAALDAGANQVVVVLNGAAPAASSAISEAWSDNQYVHIVDTGENLGSAGGYAAGLQAARGVCGEASRLWLLDDDNLPKQDCLQLQLAAAREVESRASAECVVFANRTANPIHALLARGDEPSHVFPPAGSFIYFDLLTRIRRRRRKLTSPPGDHKVREVPYGPYGGMLLPTHLAVKHGPPDVEYFVYEDDTEFTYRLALNGVSLAWIAAAIVDDQDRKWTEDSGRNGLSGMLLSEHASRLYLSVRNRAYFDLLRCSTATDYVRFTANALVYTTAVIALVVRHQRWRSAGTYFRAVVAVGPMLRRRSDGISTSRATCEA